MRYEVQVVRVLVFCLSALLLSACSSCGDGGPAVPFGLDGSARSPDEPASDDATPEVARPAEGQALPEGTPRVDVEGAALAPGGSVRALWAHDVDGDGDRDALVVASGPLRVLFARRDGARFETPRVLAHADAPEGCVISSAGLRALGSTWVIAHAEITCEDSPADARVERWILGTDRTPRALEHVALYSAEGRAPGEIALRFEADDRDEDGREDLVLAVSVRRTSEASTTLTWFDRPNGLARDTSEPEHTLNERSRDGLRRLRGAPAEALARSRDVLALHETLCREPERARLQIGRSVGLSCGESNGAGRAITTVIRAHAAMGETFEALDALASLEEPGRLINDERRRYARRALAGARGTTTVTLREGPTLASGGSGVRLSALGFIDEEHVLLRGAPARVWDLGSGETTQTDPTRSDRRVVDPSGRFVVAAVYRSCEGYVLGISAVHGGTHSTPLLVQRDPPAGVTCPQPGLDDSARRDDGGWRVLGWAPQGVVAARRDELRVIPLDLSARPAGTPETLTPGTPPPAPLPAGTASADGRFHVELRGPGVILHRVAEHAQPTLLWPEGWGAREGDVTDAAVSPSGRRVAVRRGDAVFLLSRGDD